MWCINASEPTEDNDGLSVIPRSQAFPMRPQHFFTGIHQAMADLDWAPKYDTVDAIMRDAYENDFIHVKASGGLKNDFECDDIIIAKSKGSGIIA
jgi:hypothetical protein